MMRFFLTMKGSARFPHAPNAILSAWETTLRCRGDAPAILGEGGGVLRSFREIEEEAVQWGDRLAHLGTLQAGEIAALQIGNSPEFFAILLAVFRRELVPLPLGGHLSPAERQAALEAVGASVLIGYDEERAFFIELLPLAGHPPAWPSPRPDFLKLTSGTTAAPRAIRFRAEQLLEDALQIEETMGITPADLSYGVIPIAHSYGFSHLVTPLLCRGTPLVLSEDRMPRAILNGLACSGASVFPSMPLFFDKLADLGGDLDDRVPLPKLRLCLSAGAPLPVAVSQRFTKRFGLKIHSFYGSSECGGIAYDRTGSSGLPDRDGFVGEAMSRTNITPQPDGRIVVTGAAVGDGYWPIAPGHEDEALSNGCFTPGDLIEVRPEGYYLAGRVNDIINIAGRKLNPREVEARLFCYPGLREIVVFGVPSRLRHEEAIACVVGEVDESALLEFARSVLSLWQVPKAIWRVPRIPVCERGKISRRALARQYLALPK